MGTLVHNLDSDIEQAIRRTPEGQERRFLTTRELARLLGIGESSVKRWADDGYVGAVRTAGGHRRIPVEEALRFAREWGIANGVGRRGVDRGETAIDPEAAERLVQALTVGDGERAWRLAAEEYRRGATTAAICDGLLAPAMGRIGHLWRGDEVGGIFVEHRATDICFDVLRRLQGMLPATGGNSPLAIGCAPEGDVYALPTLAASVALRECGYAAVNLGPALPMRVLRRAVEEHRPRIAWLAIGADDAQCPKADIVAHARGVADAMAGWGAFLVVGGRTVPGELREASEPNVRVFETMEQLAQFARTGEANGAAR